MKVTDEKWSEIVKVVEEGIARWNAAAAKHKTADTFNFSKRELSGHLILFTSKIGELGNSQDKAIAREIATGEIRKTKLSRKGQMVSYKVGGADPKSWASLAEKPANEIVRQLKLLDFIMFTSVSHIPADNTSTAA